MNHPFSAHLAICAGLAGCCLVVPVNAQRPATARPAAVRPPADPTPLAAALNDFGARLHDQLAANGAPTFSSASIGIALLMVLPGARGDTQAEIEQVLGLPETLRGESLQVAAQEMLQALRRPSKAKDMQFRLVDDLWVQQGYKLVPAFEKVLSGRFDSTSHAVDFRADPERSRAAINAAVAKITNDRIPELVPADLIDTDTRVVLTNAMWMRGAWSDPFQKDYTSPGKFTKVDGAQVEVPMMRMQGTFGYSADARYRCVQLDFVDHVFCCELVLPVGDTTLDAVQRDLIAGKVPMAKARTAVDIELPRFRIGAQRRLRPALEALGMKKCFGLEADFTGMREERDIHIEEVVHQTWIAVDEDGAEAAAATAVVMKRGSAQLPGKVEQFHADRPFAFVIRHVPTGLVLFSGRVLDPSLPSR